MRRYPPKGAYEDMKRTSRVFPIFVMLALLVLAMSVFVFADGVAHAASAEFRIVAKSDRDWTLYCGEDILATSDKVFFEGDSQDVASVDFYNAIKGWLAEHELGEDDYALSFSLPGFAADETGDRNIPYSEYVDGSFALTADVSSVLVPSAEKNSMSGMLQYRRAGASDYAYNDIHGWANAGGDPIRFGRVDVGKYVVRYIVIEEIIFDNITYRVRRYSDNEFECAVVGSPAPTPSVRETTATYGTPAGKISVRSSEGSFTLSQNQRDPRITEDFCLEAREEPYAVNFDFTPSNSNYLPLKDVSIAVTVAPREITVYVGDAYSRSGEPMADLSALEFSVYGLAEMDTEQDLGLEFYLTAEFDGSKAGTYLIKARCSNKNYVINENGVQSLAGWPIPGGRYVVYQYAYDAVATDGRKFTVYCDSVNAREVRVDARGGQLDILGDAPAGAASMHIRDIVTYTVSFFDASGNRAYPTGDYIVEWEGSVDGAEYLAIANSSELLVIFSAAEYDGTAHSVTLTSSQDSLLFLHEVVEYPPENVWTWFNILLLIVCCALAICLVAMLTIFARRRRILWK